MCVEALSLAGDIQFKAGSGRECDAYKGRQDRIHSYQADMTNPVGAQNLTGVSI